MLTPNPLHDPSYPLVEMCQSCGAFPVPPSHDCDPPEPVSWAPMILFIAVCGLDVVLGWAIWTGIHYMGWLR